MQRRPMTSGAHSWTPTVPVHGSDASPSHCPSHIGIARAQATRIYRAGTSVEVSMEVPGITVDAGMCN